jgi:lactate racemase
VNKPFSLSAPAGGSVTAQQVAELVSTACPTKDYRDKKVLLIIPDGTRTAPVGLLFQTLHRQIS